MPEKINLTFLGTGSAIPTARRNHPSILLSYKDENILVDCGEGTQRQFRIAHLNPCKITRILITHWHGDHVLGLPGLFQTLMLNGYTKTLQIYGPRGTARMIQVYQTFFTHKDKLSIQVHEIESEIVFENSEFIINAQPMNHETPTLSYSFTIKEKNRINKEKLEKLKIPSGPMIAELAKGKTIEVDGKKIYGKKLIFTEPQRKISFIADTLYNTNCIKLAQNSDIVISESTYVDEELDLAKEHLHLTSSQAAEIAKKSKSKQLILTHLSQRYDSDNTQVLKQAKKVFKNTTIAKDFDTVEL